MSARARLSLFVGMALLLGLAGCDGLASGASGGLPEETLVVIQPGASQTPFLPAGTVLAPSGEENAPTPAPILGALPTGAVPTSTPLAPPPAPTPTPQPALRQLTQGGCCSGPFWYPDGSRVLFLDKPGPQEPGGFWSVDLEGGPPQLAFERLGQYSPDFTLLAYPGEGTAIVERLADGVRWQIANGGRAVSFSPDSSLVAWSAGADGPPFDTARRQVWVSRVDGTEARQVVEVVGGGFSGWLPDGRLLVSSRPDPSQPVTVLSAVSLQDGAQAELLRGVRLRGISISPGGTWLAYQVTFSGDPAQDGLWLLNLASGQKTRLDLFGSYRWRDDGRLLLLPLDPEGTNQAGSHRLWQVEAATEAAAALTNPAVTAFRVANSDWAVSPTGQFLVFRSATDYNLWLLSLP